MQYSRWIFLFLFMVAIQLSWTEPGQDLFKKAKEQFQRGSKKSAIQFCQQALEYPSLDTKTRLDIGKLLVQCGEIEQGFKVLESAIQEKPTYQHYMFVADLAKDYGQIELALSHYQNALQLKEAAEPHRQLAALYEQQKQIPKALEHRSSGVSLEMPQIRGLKFKTPMQTNSHNREELKKFLLQEFEKEMPPEKALSVEASLKVFRLIPESCNIKQLMVQLLTEQVAGFYNPATKQLYLIAEPPKKEGFSSLFNWSKDDSEERMIIAHEMTHALQDQYYDLQAIEKTVKSNDDRLLAFQSLVEGDATLSMLDYQSYPDHRFSAEDIPALRMTFKFMTILMPFLEGEELKKAPNVIRESLLFPYMEGVFFTLALREDDDPWQAIDQIYQKLPGSTEQILHPEKYKAQEPVWECSLPNFVEVCGKDWKEVANNVMGEFGCRIVFQEFQLEEYENLAAGWGGDRYSVLISPYGSRALIWTTVWDSTEDAQEFYQGYAQVLKKKYPRASWKTNTPHQQQTKQYQKITMIQQKDKYVHIFEQIPQAAFPKIQQKTLQATWEKK